MSSDRSQVLSPLEDARESLAILLETERFLIEEVGCSGTLTLDNTFKWAEQVSETRRLIAAQRVAVEAVERAALAETEPTVPTSEPPTDVS